MYSSLSTLARSHYPTLPLGASASNGMWTGPYPTLARSPSAGGQSDSVFLDGPPDDPSLPPASPGRYCKDPTYPNGSQGDLETDCPNGFHHPLPFHLHHSLPRRSHGYNQSHALPGKQDMASPLGFRILKNTTSDRWKPRLYWSDFFFLPSPVQSMSIRRSRISGRGSLRGHPRCLVNAPKSDDASRTA